jgi:hypothetical protein
MEQNMKAANLRQAHSTSGHRDTYSGRAVPRLLPSIDFRHILILSSSLRMTVSMTNFSSSAEFFFFTIVVLS